MALLYGRKPGGGASTGWSKVQPRGYAAPTTPATDLPGEFAQFHAYRGLVGNPSRVLNDCLYRFLERLPFHPVFWAMVFGVGMLLPLDYFDGASSPINHVRTFTEIHASYFFLPVILVQVLVMPLFYRAALDCFDSMRPAMQCPDERVANNRKTMINPTTGFQLCAFGLILVLGCLTEEFSSARFSRFLSGNWNAFDIWLAFANMATLAIFLWFIVMPVSRTILLAKYLERTVSPRLFDDNLARPIAVFGFRAGMLFAIPYLLVASTAPIFLSDTWTFVLPGIIGAMTAVGFSLIPAMPIRRSFRKLKKQEIRTINADIADVYRKAAGDRLSGENMSELVTLLDYKREVKALSEWPFEGKFFRGFGLYFLLFPLTWVAAALVEMVIEQIAS